MFSILILFFSFLLGVSLFETKQEAVKPALKARYQVVKQGSRMPASMDDDGADEDFDQLNKGCRAPQICPSRNLQKSSELNPITRAFLTYSVSDSVCELIRIAREQIAVNPERYIVRREDGRVQTYCYGAVKDALRGADMVPGDFTGSRFARNGVTDLEAPEAGFRNLLDLPERSDPNYEAKLAVNSMLVNHPEMAPKGSILIYRTVPGALRSNGRAVDPAGHSEIKTGDVGEDGYISVSEKSEPTYGYSLVTQRTLIGVMYLPRLLSPDSIYYQGQIPF